MIQQLSSEDPSLEKLLHPRLPYRLREVVWAARYEMARTVEDILARRTRALFLDARAAIEAAPAVAEVLAKELDRSVAWREGDLLNFLTVAQGYVYLGE
jgi:glycerol-3-phosphate dehydrogenase